MTIFLDRDGVINRLMLERGPRESPLTAADFELLPGAKQALEILKFAGYKLLIITNQPNVAKGKSTKQDYIEIEERMHQLLGEKAKIDGIYACLHHPDPAQVVVKELLQECDCRKPKPGLIHQAAKDHLIDLQNAWLIGDAPSDIETGINAGLNPKHLIFIGKPYDDAITAAPDLSAASRIILKDSTP